jgi:hypothetical protein
LVGFLTDNYSYQASFLFSAGIWCFAILLSLILPEKISSHLNKDLIIDSLERVRRDNIKLRECLHELKKIKPTV